MKKIIVMALMVMLVTTMLCGSVIASAPNAGDSNPDGPGWSEIEPKPGSGIGGAPNAGDGIPDGSGW